MKYMLCYAVMEKSKKVESEYFDKFEDAVMKYTVLCSNCADVVLADVEEHKIIRHYSYRYVLHGCAATNF